MLHPALFQPTSSIPQTSAPMQVLSLEDMRAVAGGPEIKNGGSDTVAPATNVTPGIAG